VLAGRVDASAGATVIANSTAKRSGVVDVRVRSRPVHFLDADGGPHAAQLLDDVSDDGFQTMVTGQKIRWVLDVWHRVRRPPDPRHEVTRANSTTS
jgi:hypothetical protein